MASLLIVDDVSGSAHLFEAWRRAGAGRRCLDDERITLTEALSGRRCRPSTMSSGCATWDA